MDHLIRIVIDLGLSHNLLLEAGWDLTILSVDCSFDHLLLIYKVQTLWHLKIRVVANNTCQLINFLLHLLLLRRFWLPEKLVCNVRLLLLGFGYRDTGEDISLVDGELVFGPRKRIFLVLSLVEARVAFVEVRMLRLQHMQNARKPE